MTIRIIGVIIIIIGCGFGGFLFSAAYKKELQALNSYIDLLNIFECELQYRSPPLTEIFAAFSATRNDSVSDFCKQLSCELDAQVCPNVQSCVQAVLNKNNDIPPETKGLLEKMGTSLGKFNIAGQVLEIKCLRKEAQNKFAYLLKNQDSKTKNYKTLGLCAGAAIAILLI